MQQYINLMMHLAILQHRVQLEDIGEDEFGCGMYGMRYGCVKMVEHMLDQVQLLHILNFGIKLERLSAPEHWPKSE